MARRSDQDVLWVTLQTDVSTVSVIYLKCSGKDLEPFEEACPTPTLTRDGTRLSNAFGKVQPQLPSRNYRFSRLIA